jgi:hypothetical protein
VRFFAIYRTPSKHTMKPAALVEPLSFREKPLGNCLENQNRPCFGVSRAGRSGPTSSIRSSCVARNHVQLALLLFTRQFLDRLFSETELPVYAVLGNSPAYARIPIRCRGVGKRAYSSSFLVGFFPETGLPLNSILGNSGPCYAGSRKPLVQKESQQRSHLVRSDELKARCRKT